MNVMVIFIVVMAYLGTIGSNAFIILQSKDRLVTNKKIVVIFNFVLFLMHGAIIVDQMFRASRVPLLMFASGIALCILSGCNALLMHVYGIKQNTLAAIRAFAICGLSIAGAMMTIYVYIILSFAVGGLTDTKWVAITPNVKRTARFYVN